VTYLLGYAVAHAVLFFPRGRQLWELAMLRDGGTGAMRAVMSRHMAS
jgi:hypothetical protein